MTDQIVKIYSIKTGMDSVWAALTDPKQITAWGAGPAQMTAAEDTDFSLWDGDIYGRNLEVKAPTYLKQEWYSGVWKEPSIVEFELTHKNGQTELKMTQNGVPESEEEEIAKGWEQYYLGAIKSYLEEE